MARSGKTPHVAEGLWEKPVQYAVLFGQYECTIDSKNRLLIPARIRNELQPDRDGTAFFIVTGDNGKLWLYPEKIYASMAEGVKQELAPDEDDLAFDHLHYSLADRLEWDAQGRILLPDRELKETGTGKDVVLIGSRNHLEIFNASEWHAYRENLRKRSKEVSLRAKQKKVQDQGV